MREVVGILGLSQKGVNFCYRLIQLGRAEGGEAGVFAVYRDIAINGGELWLNYYSPRSSHTPYD